MATRALPDLIARIRVDSTGVDSAMSNLVGSFGRANLALAGAAAGIGILVGGVKSMVDISQAHTKATNNLAQAVEAYNSSIGKTAPVTAEMTAAIAKAADTSSKAADSLTIAQNGATRAQLAYSDAVRAHGAKSEQALKASLSLQDATIRLKQAQDAAVDSSQALAAAQATIGVKVAGSAINLNAYQKQINDFIMTNRRYISDQSEVVNSYAVLTRSGLAQTEVTRVMNDAVDLSALKSISLTDAVTILNNAEHGRMRGLIDLGITTTKMTDAQGNLVNSTRDVGAAMDQVDLKVKNGKLTLTPYQQAIDSINISWQNFAIEYGPQVVDEMSKMADGVAANMPTWTNWLGTVINIGNQLAALGPLSDAASAKLHNDIFNTLHLKQYELSVEQRAAMAPGVGYNTTTGQYIQAGLLAPGMSVNPTTGAVVKTGLAGGGSALPGGIYTVGENGPETLVMGARGGTVIPNGGNTYHTHLTLNGSSAVNNPEGVRTMLQRMQLLGVGS